MLYLQIQFVPMSVFSDNIRFLRGKKDLAQQGFADQLEISRERYSKYESGRSEPPYEILIKISKFFHISIDLLLTVDIRKYPLEGMLKLPDNRIVLPVIVDPQGNNYIEIVPQKASMGYLNGYSDPEYMESLQRMNLPFLKHGKFRGFLADGDSMPPFADGSYVIGEYVENIADLKPQKEYIFVTPQGLTYKTLVAINSGSITVSADNPFYPPYEIPLEDLVEIWRYVRGILPQDYKPNQSYDTGIKSMFMEIKKDIKDLDAKVSTFKS